MLFEIITGYFVGKYLFTDRNNDAVIWQNILLIKEQVNDAAIAELESTYRSIPWNERNELAKNMKTFRESLKSVRKSVSNKKLRKEIDDLMDKCRKIENICNRWF